MSETPAEIGSDLISRLDGTGGDYTELKRALENCDGSEEIEDIRNKVIEADLKLDEAFSKLESVMDKADFSGETNEFTENVKTEVAEISNLIEEASENTESALYKSEQLDTQEVCPDFKFGAHTEVKSSVEFINSQAKRLDTMVTEMVQKI